jgi:ATP-dependent Lon protease
VTETRHVPLFPLELVLFPGELLPLHIFEPRYKEMVDRCLETGEPFVVLTQIGEEVAEVGCSARIRRVLRRYPDGRLDIETEGEGRVKVIETFSDHSYLTGAIERLPESATAVDSGQKERATALHMKLLEVIGGDVRPSSYSGAPLVSFAIAPSAGLDVENRLELLQIDDESDRLIFLIDHLRKLIPRVEEARDRQRRISSNGHFKEKT